MESGLSSSSKHNTLHPPFDDYDYIDVDEIEEEEELKLELACPFCLEGFDAFGLFCHIDDEHSIEAKSRICPICETNLRTNVASHLITQHDIILKTLHKNKICGDDSGSILSLLKKELEYESLRSVAEGSSCSVSSSKMAPDPLLMSFIYNSDEPEIVKPCSLTATSLSEMSSNISMIESGENIQRYSSVEDQEKAQRCEFVNSLLFSTILDDNL